MKRKRRTSTATATTKAGVTGRARQAGRAKSISNRLYIWRFFLKCESQTRRRVQQTREIGEL